MKANHDTSTIIVAAYPRTIISEIGDLPCALIRMLNDTGNKVAPRVLRIVSGWLKMLKQEPITLQEAYD